MVRRLLGRPIVIYVVLALIVMGQGLMPGYLLALDTIWSPNMPLPNVIDNAYPLWAALHYLSILIPAQILQKILLVGVLAGAALGAHRLVKRWGLPGGATGAGGLTPYYAGLLYMINPFVYGRFLTGQFLVLLGYALIPYFLSALWDFLNEQNKKSAAKVILWAASIGMVSIHSVFFMALLLAVSLVARLVGRRRQTDWRRLLCWGAAVAGIWLAVSSYWLLPLVAGTGETTGLIGGFDRHHVELFKTTSDVQYGVVFNAAAMHGFWADNQGYYRSLKYIAVWPLLASTFMILAAIGMIVTRRRPESWVLAVVGAAALVLGVGVAFGPFAGLYNWCFAHVPLFKGYREPQKFIGLLVLAYAYLGAVGTGWVAESVGRLFRGRSSRAGGRILTTLVLLSLPLVYAHSMLCGFGGQLRPVEYPADWYLANNELKADPGSYKILFLPWHQYLTLGFTGKVVANPAQAFFGDRVVQSTDMEFGNVNNVRRTRIDAAVEKIVLDRSANSIDAARPLSELGVKYVVLAKNHDLSRYAWLDKQTSLQVQTDGPSLRVYVNTDWRE